MSSHIFSQCQNAVFTAFLNRTWKRITEKQRVENFIKNIYISSNTKTDHIYLKPQKAVKDAENQTYTNRGRALETPKKRSVKSIFFQCGLQSYHPGGQELSYEPPKAIIRAVKSYHMGRPNDSSAQPIRHTWAERADRFAQDRLKISEKQTSKPHQAEGGAGHGGRLRESAHFSAVHGTRMAYFS